MSVQIYSPPKKIDVSKAYYEEGGSWVGDPRCQAERDIEKSLIARRADLLIHAEISDDAADYSYDDFALVSLDGNYYLLQTSGCSCPSPAETWGIDIGLATLEEIRAFITSGNYDGYTVPVKQIAEFMQALDSAGAP